MIIDRLTEQIGQTPLMRLGCRHNGWSLYLKLEKFNPGGSMKDRMARGMIDDTERRGDLKPGGTIVESSSGNTGTGLAMVAAERGYRFIVVVDHHAAGDKIGAMRALGADVVRVGGDGAEDRVATAERERRAREIADSMPGAVVMMQHENASNPEAYIDTLARDLLRDVPAIDILIGSVGTGGSLCGTAEGVRRQVPGVRVIGVEPKGSIVFGAPGGPYFQSGTGVPADVSVGSTVHYDTIDLGITVDDPAAFNACRFLAHRFGLLVGGSAGAVVYAAAAQLRDLTGQGAMVAILGDGGEKYMDTIFNDLWIAERNLLDLQVEADLASTLTTWEIAA